MEKIRLNKLNELKVKKDNCREELSKRNRVFLSVIPFIASRIECYLDPLMLLDLVSTHYEEMLPVF